MITRPRRLTKPLLAACLAALALLPLEARLLAAADRKATPAAVREWVRAHEIAILREFADLLAIPNLARDGPNIRRNAEHIAALLGRRGLTTRLLDGEGGPPVVYGERSSPGARRTIVVYAHYDGQPVTEADWATPPWTPTLRDGPVEAGGREIALDGLTGPVRGSGVSTAARPATTRRPSWPSSRPWTPSRRCQVRTFGQPEGLLRGRGGSGLAPPARRSWRRTRELLKADVWLLCDGPVHQSRRPQRLLRGARRDGRRAHGLRTVARRCTAGTTATGPPTPRWSWPTSWPACATPTGGSGSPASTTTFGRPRRPRARGGPRFPRRGRRAAARAGAGRDRRRQRPARGADHAARPQRARARSRGPWASEAANAIPTEASASIDFRLVPDQTPERVQGPLRGAPRAAGLHVVHETPDACDERRAQARLVQLQWQSGYPRRGRPWTRRSRARSWPW